jgi:hypothetical protein
MYIGVPFVCHTWKALCIAPAVLNRTTAASFGVTARLYKAASNLGQLFALELIPG